MKNTVKNLLSKESLTVFWMPPLSSGTSEVSSVRATPKVIREWLIVSQEDSHVSHSAMQEKNKERMINETCGLQQSKPYGYYNLKSRSWKTAQCCLFQTTFGMSSLLSSQNGFIIVVAEESMPIYLVPQCLVRQSSENDCFSLPSP